MDISVKKLSEILKIDPQALLDKMIAAGLPQNSIEDTVSNEDKQKLLSFIRSSKDSAKEDKPKAVVPASPAPKATPKKDKVKKSKDVSESEDKKAEVKKLLLPIIDKTLDKISKENKLKGFVVKKRFYEKFFFSLNL